MQRPRQRNALPEHKSKKAKEKVRQRRLQADAYSVVASLVDPKALQQHPLAAVQRLALARRGRNVNPSEGKQLRPREECRGEDERARLRLVRPDINEGDRQDGY